MNQANNTPKRKQDLVVATEQKQRKKNEALFTISHGGIEAITQQ